MNTVVNPTLNSRYASPSQNWDGKPCRGCLSNSSDMNSWCGSGYPGGNPEDGDFPNPFGQSNHGKNTAIQDLIKVPQVTPGEYVVGFRSVSQSVLTMSCTFSSLFLLYCDYQKVTDVDDCHVVSGGTAKRPVRCGPRARTLRLSRFRLSKESGREG